MNKLTKIGLGAVILGILLMFLPTALILIGIELNFFHVGGYFGTSAILVCIGLLLLIYRTIIILKERGFQTKDLLIVIFLPWAAVLYYPLN
jgi:hypothetical protein